MAINISKTKFGRFVGQSSNGISQERAKLAFEDAEAAASNKIREMKEELRELRRTELTLSDIAPTNAMDTSGVTAGFQGKTWFGDLLAVRISITDRTKDLNDAENLYKEYFTEADDTTEE